MLSVYIKFLGDLRLIKKNYVKIDLRENATIKNMLDKLTKVYGRDLKEMIIDPSTGQIRPYIILVVDGQEINAYDANGLNLKLEDECMVTIAPTVGGG